MDVKPGDQQQSPAVSKISTSRRDLDSDVHQTSDSNPGTPRNNRDSVSSLSSVWAGSPSLAYSHVYASPKQPLRHGGAGHGAIHDNPMLATSLAVARSTDAMLPSPFQRTPVANGVAGTPNGEVFFTPYTNALAAETPASDGAAFYTPAGTLLRTGPLPTSAQHTSVSVRPDYGAVSVLRPLRADTWVPSASATPQLVARTPRHDEELESISPVSSTLSFGPGGEEEEQQQEGGAESYGWEAMSTQGGKSGSEVCSVLSPTAATSPSAVSDPAGFELEPASPVVDAPAFAPASAVASPAGPEVALSRTAPTPVSPSASPAGQTTAAAFPPIHSQSEIGSLDASGAALAAMCSGAGAESILSWASEDGQHKSQGGVVEGEGVQGGWSMGGAAGGADAPAATEVAVQDVQLQVAAEAESAVGDEVCGEEAQHKAAVDKQQEANSPTATPAQPVCEAGTVAEPSILAKEAAEEEAEVQVDAEEELVQAAPAGPPTALHVLSSPPRSLTHTRTSIKSPTIPRLTVSPTPATLLAAPITPSSPTKATIPTVCVTAEVTPAIQQHAALASDAHASTAIGHATGSSVGTGAAENDDVAVAGGGSPCPDFVFQPITVAALPGPVAQRSLSSPAAQSPATGLLADGTTAPTPFLLKRVRPATSPLQGAGSDTPGFGSPMHTLGGGLGAAAQPVGDQPHAVLQAASAHLAATAAAHLVMEDERNTGEESPPPVLVAAAAPAARGLQGTAGLTREELWRDLLLPASARVRTIAPLTLPQSPKLSTTARSKRPEPSAAFLAAMGAQVAAQRRASAAHAAAAAERRHSAAHSKAAAIHKAAPATAVSGSKVVGLQEIPVSMHTALVEAAAVRLGTPGAPPSPQASRPRTSLTGSKAAPPAAKPGAAKPSTSAQPTAKPAAARAPVPAATATTTRRASVTSSASVLQPTSKAAAGTRTGASKAAATTSVAPPAPASSTPESAAMPRAGSKPLTPPKSPAQPKPPVQAPGAKPGAPAAVAAQAATAAPAPRTATPPRLIKLASPAASTTLANSRPSDIASRATAKPATADPVANALPVRKGPHAAAGSTRPVARSATAPEPSSTPTSTAAKQQPTMAAAGTHAVKRAAVPAAMPAPAPAVVQVPAGVLATKPAPKPAVPKLHAKPADVAAKGSKASEGGVASAVSEVATAASDALTHRRRMSLKPPVPTQAQGTNSVATNPAVPVALRAQTPVASNPQPTATAATTAHSAPVQVAAAQKLKAAQEQTHQAASVAAAPKDVIVSKARTPVVPPQPVSSPAQAPAVAAKTARERRASYASLVPKPVARKAAAPAGAVASAAPASAAAAPAAKHLQAEPLPATRAAGAPAAAALAAVAVASAEKASAEPVAGAVVPGATAAVTTPLSLRYLPVSPSPSARTARAAAATKTPVSAGGSVSFGGRARTSKAAGSSQASSSNATPMSKLLTATAGAGAVSRQLSRPSPTLLRPGAKLMGSASSTSVLKLGSTSGTGVVPQQAAAKKQDFSACWAVTPTASLEVTPGLAFGFGAATDSEAPTPALSFGPAMSGASSQDGALMVQPTPFLLPHARSMYTQGTGSAAPTPVSAAAPAQGMRTNGAIGAPTHAGAQHSGNARTHGAATTQKQRQHAVAAPSPAPSSTSSDVFGGITMTPAPALMAAARPVLPAVTPEFGFPSLDLGHGSSREAHEHLRHGHPLTLSGQPSPTASALSGSSMPSPPKCLSPDTSAVAESTLISGPEPHTFQGLSGFAPAQPCEVHVSEEVAGGMNGPSDYASYMSELGAIRISTFELLSGAQASEEERPAADSADWC